MRSEIAEGPVPTESGLERGDVASAWFSDSYRVQLGNPSLSVIDLFEAAFGHHPGWVRSLLHFRNRLAAWAGLEVPPKETIVQFERKARYAVGDLIGPWPIFALSEKELIAGRDNRHLDFRVSVLRLDAPSPTAVFSTICNVHNRFGKIYLFFIAPFHRWGMRKLLRQAAASGRL